jgi:hypothetical protein
MHPHRLRLLVLLYLRHRFPRLLTQVRSLLPLHPLLIRLPLLHRLPLRPLILQCCRLSMHSYRPRN